MDTYGCNICGNIVQVEFAGKGALSCCGQVMNLLSPRTEDSSLEKHVPFIVREEGGVRVRIGKDAKHPMVPEHYIVYIEVVADGVTMRRYLRPGDEPEAFFKVDASDIEATELCNVHGVWVS